MSRDSVTSEPTTEAGRQLLVNLNNLMPPLGDRSHADRIVAIEAEARADAHSCANHDESLDQAYRKGYAEARAAEKQRVARLRKRLAFALSCLRSGERLTPDEDGDIEAILADTAAPETGWATVARADLEEPAP